ncbi:uncharacterized protein LY89DRAFT_741193 [Mollisia scopiformis]|uniref:Uncharacterized protein n=1 Tax=Mollisia scopiformis TaxID=149040 RepID=A0A132BAS1_MOLSC|nr:uncharacterized protein LY89DRAFT_741193 [Mollisia scopiformis]KUJ09486.1 hypothetical protein LY89DRAFT_741193 [Mollisia scopiformis]
MEQHHIKTEPYIKSETRDELHSVNPYIKSETENEIHSVNAYIKSEHPDTGSAYMKSEDGKVKLEEFYASQPLDQPPAISKGRKQRNKSNNDRAATKKEARRRRMQRRMAASIVKSGIGKGKRTNIKSKAPETMEAYKRLGQDPDDAEALETFLKYNPWFVEQRRTVYQPGVGMVRPGWKP